MSQMKKLQPSGAQNRKKKRGRVEDESHQRGALDAWIKRSKEEVGEPGEVKDDVGAEKDFSDADSARSEHNTLSPQSRCQDDDPCEENKEDFSIFLQRSDFGCLKKPIPDHLKMTILQHGPERYQNKSAERIKVLKVHLLRRMGDHFPNSGLIKFPQTEKLWRENGCCTLHIGKHATVLFAFCFQRSICRLCQTLERKTVSPLGEN